MTSRRPRDGARPTRPVAIANRHPRLRFDRSAVTRVIASHDLEMVLELCRRVVLLDRGRIVADGPAEQILGDTDLLRAHRLEPPLSLTLRAR